MNLLYIRIYINIRYLFSTKYVVHGAEIKLGNYTYLPISQDIPISHHKDRYIHISFNVLK